MSNDTVSIKQAAQLLNVSENTLREWDKNGKFPASRTSGSHRRYNIDAIRNHLMSNKVKETVVCTPKACTNYDKEAERALDLHRGYVGHIEDDLEAKNLALLIENNFLYYELATKTDESLISNQQLARLITMAWSLCQFTKYVSVKTMLGPVGLAEYIDNRSNRKTKEFGVRISAITSFEIFPDENFETCKEFYAKRLASYIDSLILNHLPNISEEQVEAFFNKYVSLGNPDIVCYLIAPKKIIEKHKSLEEIGVQFHKIPYVTQNTVTVMKAGFYRKDNKSLPQFCPYLFSVKPTIYGETLQLRYGWVDSNEITFRIDG